jgi:LysM repeat protein
MNQNLRYLLARRLTRANRGNESRPYYPPYWLDSFDGLVQALRDGWSETLPQSDRAAALRKAAFITRTNGMELLGTEMEPDWSIHDGNFEGELTWANRSTNQFDAKIVPAAREEIIRASHRNPDPDERFHYRYQAAFLGWSAASLMTNNTDECAQMLCVAGTWLKQRDPDTADVFYKALVLRNRQTPLGKEADVKRWFPRMDRTGNRIEERQPENEAIVNHLMTGDTEPDDPGTIEIIDPNADTDQTSGPPPDAYEYIVRSGDTLVRISQIISAAGNPVSVQDLQDCNQLMTPSRLRIGQKLIIPFRGDTVQN